MSAGGPAVLTAWAQQPDPPPTSYQPLSDQQLDQLLGPIALYPDPLLGEILPAATMPWQIVLADRYVSDGGDPGSIGQQPWDPSVQALAHYPAVLKYLDENLSWTAAVGQAFLYQQPQVMESIQRLRMSAQNLGNLWSTPQQQVVDDAGDIEILPTEPDVIYVPVYSAGIYCQSGVGLSFGAGCALGPWLACDFDWVHRGLRLWGRDLPRPDQWWHLPAWKRAVWLASATTTWQPRNRGLAGVNRDARAWNRPIATRTASIAPAQSWHQSWQPPFRQQPQQQFQLFHPGNTVVHWQHSAPVANRWTGGAFVGSSGSRAQEIFGDRRTSAVQPGFQRALAQFHAAPVSHSATSFNGGGGGSHGGSRR
jgi:hypothetical protein